MEIYLNWISGAQIGLEFLSGEQILPEDKLVIMISFVIFRVSVVINR